MKREKPIVYVIQQLPNGPFKIGISKDPVSYLKTIQEQNPNEIVLRSMITPGNLSAKTLEKRACESLAGYQVRNQWFDGLTLETIENIIKMEREGLIAKKSIPWKESLSYSENLNCELTERLEILHNYTPFNYIIENLMQNDSNNFGNEIMLNAHNSGSEWKESKFKTSGNYPTIQIETRLVPKSTPAAPFKADFSDLPDMKERITKHIEKTNRYDISISKDVELTLWIIEQTNTHNPLPFKERVYSAFHDISPICKYGKKKKFRTFKEGYSKCHLEMCRCKREEKQAITAGILYVT